MTPGSTGPTGGRRARFERVEGRPVDAAAVPELRLEDRRVEVLLPGEADTWVAVPALNEAAGIRATLHALEAQTLRPLVVCVVDNGSTDGTTDVVRAWAAQVALRAAEGGLRPAQGVVGSAQGVVGSAEGGVRPAEGGLGIRLAFEPEKGTGAASDTGMRLAAVAGATYLLRTDADSLPVAGWAARMRERLAGGLDLVAGRMVDRPDEGNPLGRRLILWILVKITAVISVPKNLGPGYKTRFRLMMGSNVGIRATTYLAAGGFPRSAIEEVHDDRALMNRVRRVTERIGGDRRAVVASSTRRYRLYGLRGVIRWYLDHDSGGAPIDVR